MADTRDIESLLGQYWDLAYSEGQTGVSRGSEAQVVLSKLRALASRPAEVDDEAQHALRLLKAWRLKVQEQGYGSVESAIDDAIAAKDPAYKLVPIEPTKEMIWACKDRFVPRIALPFFVAAYKTMIEAAPSHTTNKEKD